MSGWDTLVKVMFAPCAGDMNVGGVPREDLGEVASVRSRTGHSSGRGRASGNNTVPSWGASVPFEVSASQDKMSSFQASSVSQHTQDLNESIRLPTQQLNPLPQQRAQTPREQRKARSRAKLRQLGAQHQLAGGFPGESLADTARPISPQVNAEELAAAGEDSPDLVDFDDGISAISSHTLEEMHRRQTREKKHVLRLHPLDFSQIIDENTELKFSDRGLEGEGIPEESEEKNTEVVFGEPFYEEELFKNVVKVDDSHDNQHLEFSPASDLNRVGSSKTHKTLNTTITEESHEMEEMCKRHEAMYWIDQDQVAHNEMNAKSTRCRSTQRLNIEERARRLRELSRSRSRSDGTGSSNKSGSSLVSGQHPHDTVPVYSSDLFRRKKSSGSSRSRGSRRSQQHDALVPESRIAPRPLVKEDSDPFSSLDYGEI